MPKIRGRKETEQLEREVLRRGAALSSSPRLAQRAYPTEPDAFRTEFQRDYTRIIHSRAFRRLRHKTQVFISPRNDHLCTRLEHSLHVASVAGTIARCMRLNEDLVQAIAVGHDLGHAPFGHAGERVLDRTARRNGLRFAHELHSLRVVDRLDSPYALHAGLNLTFAVRDGIACHYGEGFEPELSPDRSKKPADLGQTQRGHSRPTTLEGCVVRWADKIAYLGRDLEDAIELGILKADKVPRVVRDRLGTSNRAIINALIADLLAHSRRDCLRVSDATHEALNALYDFNMTCIYRSPHATDSFAQIKRALPPLFSLVRRLVQSAQRLKSPEPTDTDIAKAFANASRLPGDDVPWTLRVFAVFLAEDIRTWKQEDPAQVATDFIAGMTDSFFVTAFTELFFPQGVR